MDDDTGRDPHRDLSAASRRVLETLTDAADVDGLTALGLETIAARADTSVRTVTRALTALRASGLIVQVRASKAHAPTVYRLTPDGSRRSNLRPHAAASCIHLFRAETALLLFPEGDRG